MGIAGAMAPDGARLSRGVLEGEGFDERYLKGLRVAGLSATAAVRLRKRVASEFNSSAVGSFCGAGRRTAAAGGVVGMLWFGDTASHVARIPPPPNQSALSVVRVITTVPS
jgi:hypothetical protein